jgi:hypothetical protein
LFAFQRLPKKIPFQQDPNQRHQQLHLYQEPKMEEKEERKQQKEKEKKLPP